jgi:hypothetical protein
MGPAGLELCSDDFTTYSYYEKDCPLDFFALYLANINFNTIPPSTNKC